MCGDVTPSRAFLSVVAPPAARWVAVAEPVGWTIYEVDEGRVVRIVASEQRADEGDTLHVTARFLDGEGEFLEDRRLTGKVAG